MNELLIPLTINFTFTGILPVDSANFLTLHGYPATARHSQEVASQAASLAQHFGENPLNAQTAGWLHDISVVIHPSHRLEAARSFGLDICPAEEAFPLLLHQKISAVIAEQIFKVTDPSLLSAIACHTTLKASSTRLDKVVFVADKLNWDQTGEPPYLEAMYSALALSLEHSALVYINYLWEHRDKLKGPLHPWVLEARQELQRFIENDIS